MLIKKTKILRERYKSAKNNHVSRVSSHIYITIVKWGEMVWVIVTRYNKRLLWCLCIEYLSPNYFIMPYVLQAAFIHVKDLSECIKLSMMGALQFVREHGNEHGVVGTLQFVREHGTEHGLMPQHVRKIRVLLVCVLTFCPAATDAYN